MKKLIYILLCMLWSACNKETLDFENPDIKLFVNQLKEGNYVQPEQNGDSNLPHFNYEDIEKLLPYADDLSIIPTFPLAPVSYSAGGKLRLGECILWTIESIRLGRYASMGCKLVYANADNYEGIYFLSDDELKEVAKLYRLWWQEGKKLRTVWHISPHYEDPLYDSKYMWW
ncbi:MAG: DUF4943 domain-containing protein [Mediterranea massiliensis]|nr:DUF4943 domain-containing protein [Mediterranea massiliensis]